MTGRLGDVIALVADSVAAAVAAGDLDMARRFADLAKTQPEREALRAALRERGIDPRVINRVAPAKGGKPWMFLALGLVGLGLGYMAWTATQRERAAEARVTRAVRRYPRAVTA